jgi:hypothetical protein
VTEVLTIRSAAECGGKTSLLDYKEYWRHIDDTKLTDDLFKCIDMLDTEDNRKTVYWGVVRHLRTNGCLCEDRTHGHYVPPRLAS